MKYKALSFSLPSIRSFLISAFVFLGPLGNLLTPHFLSFPFRFYYFLLSFFPLFYPLAYFKEFKSLLIPFPFLFYCLLSAFFTRFADLPLEAQPFFRFFLFGSQCLFVIGAAMHLRDSDLLYEKSRLIKLYLFSFFLSLLVGYIFYIGFYLGKVSFATITRFSVLTQIGYSILRFSPGSYPNEYGNVSSFVLSILTFLIVGRKEIPLPHFFSRKLLYIAFFLTFLALLLTTTRAAYLSYFFSCFYLLIISFGMRKALIKMAVASGTFLLCLEFFYSKLLLALFSVLQALTDKLGSMSTRLNIWTAGAQKFIDSPLFGNGFGFHYRIHNVYLQFLFELGIIGAFLLLLTLLCFLASHQRSLSSLFFKRHMAHEDFFTNRVIVIGLIHVFWFALTNHNLNHHLTWFIFLLMNMHLFSRKRIEKFEETSYLALGLK